jgi:hypothetical protein
MTVHRIGLPLALAIPLQTVETAEDATGLIGRRAGVHVRGGEEIPARIVEVSTKAPHGHIIVLEFDTPERQLDIDAFIVYGP